MSADEPFLSRWSRRKRQGEPAEPPAHESLEAPAGDAETVPAGPQASVPRVDAAEEGRVDLSRLPSIESIDAATDIRDFLSRGVPAALSRAALRRAWAADPAIRDFIGLSENAWDFNAPDGVPGFGPLLPSSSPASLTEMAERALAPSRGRLPEPERAESAAEDASPGGETTSEALEDHMNVRLEADASPVSTPSDDLEQGRIADQSNQDVAAPQLSIVREPESVMPRRRHGGALPS
jgi:hypothetical protein